MLSRDKIVEEPWIRAALDRVLILAGTTRGHDPSCRAGEDREQSVG